ncbi:MAG TPA: hydrolase TatD [Chloroflexi bacterium]|nr:hydrolase TatD [Chloroflexota bacterium]
MLTDTHCHLHLRQFDLDRDEVMARAEANGVTKIIEVGIDLESDKEAIVLATRHLQLYAAVGIHPHEAGKATQETWAELRSLASQPDVVAIGETGLDYYRRRSPREKQKEALRRQLTLARELKKPVILHDREAHDDLLAMLEEHGEGLAGVFHCFSGDLAMAEKCLEMGFYISIAGPVTYKSAHRLRELAHTLPLERLLLETDSPFLSPYGGRNEPANVRAVAQKIAEVRGIPWEEVARTTTKNAALLFGL